MSFDHDDFRKICEVAKEMGVSRFKYAEGKDAFELDFFYPHPPQQPAPDPTPPTVPSKAERDALLAEKPAPAVSLVTPELRDLAAREALR